MKSSHWNIALTAWLLLQTLIVSVQCTTANEEDNRESAVPVESAPFHSDVSDSVIVDYHDDEVMILNPRPDIFSITADGADVNITSTGGMPFVCLVKGSCGDGCLVVDADTTMTLVLDNLELASQKASAISLRQKQRVRIELPSGSHSTLQDAPDYLFADTTETVNGCLYARGSLTFTGEGSLTVTGNYRHGIASGKSISVEDCHIIIDNVVKDGIHCDAFTMRSGIVGLFLQGDASKGIKAKEDISISGGVIEGEATGGVTVSGGIISYCSLLKSNGTMDIAGGTLTLTHHGDGGRCISVDKDLTIVGGTFDLAGYGDGGSFIGTNDKLYYYTPKCITVDDSLYIAGGTVNCLSTGLGGKGIVAGKYIAIGSGESNASPVIRVDTKGECIVNNVDEDLRYGCPKGIKAGERLCILGGDIAITTAGMGGEGVESNGTMLVSGGTLECVTFDDGINVARSIEIAGGQVYCNSADNDGIDSNGSITISGGIVASVNQKRPNESFDAEDGQFYVSGGLVFGIGSAPVKVKEAACPFYSTQYDEGTQDGGLILEKDKYVCVRSGSDVVMALKNGNRALRAFLTLCHPSLKEGEQYLVSEGDRPTGFSQSFFGGKLIVWGLPGNSRPIMNIQVEKK